MEGDAVFLEWQRTRPVAQRDQAFDVTVAAFDIEGRLDADTGDTQYGDAGQARIRSRLHDARGHVAQGLVECPIGLLEVDGGHDQRCAPGRHGLPAFDGRARAERGQPHERA